MTTNSQDEWEEKLEARSRAAWKRIKPVADSLRAEFISEKSDRLPLLEKAIAGRDVKLIEQFEARRERERRDRETVNRLLALSQSDPKEYCRAYRWETTGRQRLSLPAPDPKLMEKYYRDTAKRLRAEIATELAQIDAETAEEWAGIEPRAEALRLELLARKSRLSGRLKEAIANRDTEEIERLIHINFEIVRRHEDTDYDQMLSQGVRKEDARSIISDRRRWEK